MLELTTTKTYEVGFKNEALNAATNEVLDFAKDIQSNLYGIAYIIAKVADSKCYEDDDFKNVHEWTEKTFGFKKSASYTLLKIGREYTMEEILDGKVIGYKSNLTDEGEKDFTTTQIECMLPIGNHDVIVDVVKMGEITPDMTCKEIKQYVKELKAIEAKVESNDIMPEPEKEYGGITMRETEPDISVMRETEPDVSIMTDVENDFEMIDPSAAAIQSILNALDILIADERLKNEWDYLSDMKNNIYNIEL